MNKNWRKGLLCPFLTQKNFRVMKLTLALLTVVLLEVSAVESNAQTAKISLKVENVTVKEALKHIEKKSEYTFFYNDKTINVNSFISLNADNQTVSNILLSILPNCEFKVNGKQIVIMPKNEDTTSVQQQKKNSLRRDKRYSGDAYYWSQCVR